MYRSMPRGEGDRDGAAGRAGRDDLREVRGVVRDAGGARPSRAGDASGRGYARGVATSGTRDAGLIPDRTEIQAGPEDRGPQEESRPGEPQVVEHGRDLDATTIQRASTASPANRPGGTGSA